MGTGGGRSDRELWTGGRGREHQSCKVLRLEGLNWSCCPSPRREITRCRLLRHLAIHRQLCGKIDGWRLLCSRQRLLRLVCRSPSRRTALMGQRSSRFHASMDPRVDVGLINSAPQRSEKAAWHTRVVGLPIPRHASRKCQPGTYDVQVRTRSSPYCALWRYRCGIGHRQKPIPSQWPHRQIPRKCGRHLGQPGPRCTLWRQPEKTNSKVRRTARMRVGNGGGRVPSSENKRT